MRRRRCGICINNIMFIRMRWMVIDINIGYYLSFYLAIALHATCPGTPPIVVFANCPSHFVDMKNLLTTRHKTVCMDAIRDLVRSIGRKRWDVVKE